MRTDVIRSTVAGTRPGMRERVTTYTRTRRFDYYDGHGRYTHTGNETDGSIRRGMSCVDLAVVPIGADRTVSFDPHHMVMPRKGDAVHVLVHRIGGAVVHDLYEDSSRRITVESDFPFGEPDRGWPILLTVVGTLVLIWLGHDQWWSLQRAGAAGLALYALSHARRLYVAWGLAYLRWRAARRVTRSLGAK